MSDPLIGAVTLKITGTSAQLIGKLAEALGTDGGSVLMRALGLLDLALKAKRDGKQIAFYDPAREELSEVAF